MVAREDGDRSLEPLLAAWAEHDRAVALHPIDVEAIRATRSARSLVLELFAARDARDLFNACARLGGLMGEAGASPSLVAGTVDNAARALADAGRPSDPTRLPSARASLVEGYAATLRDAGRAAMLASWEYPACAVKLEDGAVAIACGFPEADGEALAAWAAKIASHLAKDGVKRVVLAGPDAQRSEVASALALVGVEVGPPRKRPFYRLLF